MALGMEVGLGPYDTVLDAEPAPPRKGAQQPHFSGHVYCGQTVAHLSNCSTALVVFISLQFLIFSVYGSVW